VIEITVKVSTYVESDGEFRTVDVPLLLETSAPVTADGAAPTLFGRWQCRYYYLGADLTGKYFVRNNYYLPANPCGFFLDSEGKDDDPFLVLQGFNPTVMKVGAAGDGRILRTRMSSVKYPDVRWTCNKV
jgi:hypothetical protein